MPSLILIKMHRETLFHLSLNVLANAYYYESIQEVYMKWCVMKRVNYRIRDEWGLVSDVFAYE